MTTPDLAIDTAARGLDRKKLLRRMGAAGFTFFLVKGLLWLIVPGVLWLVNG